MKKIATASVLSFVLGAAVIWLARPPAPAPAAADRSNAKEFAILQVGMIEVGGRTICGLVSNPPDSILTHNTQGGGKAEWTIVGNCGDTDVIAINPDLREGGTPKPGLITPTGPPRVSAKHGERLRAVVRPTAPSADYEYEVLINNAPAEYASPASRGLFAICPEWPCRREAIDR
jgi:hypothetical protein